jgi:ABC-type lipoprotein export system ATPase subunit
MALLELKDIGKIYVSEGNVAVGIRGVNLSFEKGEFVAITGKSGSGKSTLLNVISGMDSYEEGEMFVCGQPTSHYLQPEWEQYRQEYISFIFQDYNIIESFTVLQNVELALLHIEDKRERRKRALELLNRVGLGDRIKQKGSKLSGGQKQRTVIARALAKDSPIILADEPTGNLDSKTSEEIIELLREVSKDKLLIVVTHNFEQVEHFATRHVRIYDGAVESDHRIADTASAQTENADADTESGESAEQSESGQISERAKKRKARIAAFKKGFSLGGTLFAAKPKLSVFICVLLIIGTVAIFAVTSVCGDSINLFEKNYMFEHIEGRVVIASNSGKVFSEDDVKTISEDYGANSYLMYDLLLDYGMSNYVYVSEAENGLPFKFSYGEHLGKNIVGREPEANNEVLLYLPISWQPYFGKKEVKIKSIQLQDITLSVCGVKYFYDNTKDAKMIFTKDGFRAVTCLYYLSQRLSPNISVSVILPDGSQFSTSTGTVIPSFDLKDGELYIKDDMLESIIKRYDNDISIHANLMVYYKNYDYGTQQSTEKLYSKIFLNDEITFEPPQEADNVFGSAAFVSVSTFYEIAEEILAKSYRQASLFYSSDKAAHAAAAKLQSAGYIAVPSDTTFEPDAYEKILSTVLNVVMLLIWLIAIVFLAFVVNLCTSRSMAAFKSDMGIMRSMGIPAAVVRIGIYARMFLSLLPAYAFLLAAALTVFLTPLLNGFFTFLHAWQYALIIVGMLLLTLRVTRKQIGKLFRENVKKSIKGGSAE